MAYVIQSDLESFLSDQELAELTDDTVDDVDTIDAAIVADILAKAESVVDSYLAKQYNVPLIDAPESVKDAVLVVAKYKLFARRSVPDDILREQYEDTLKWLTKVASGQLELDPDVVTSAIDDTSVGLAGDEDSMVFDNQIFQ